MSGAAVVELSYRSPGAFLVAYATQLCKGGMFVETGTPPPVGVPLTLRLAAPAARSVIAEGVVAWTRAAAGAGQPAGMGVTLTSDADALAAAVDDLAVAFGGVQVLLRTGEAAPRATLGRYIRSILSCDIVDVDLAVGDDATFARMDLAVVDLDSTGPAGLELCARLRAHPGARSVPVLALAQLERDREGALRLGFDDAVANPPVFAELEASVLRCLGKPAVVDVRR